jgi:hypothetical protein
MSSLAYSTEDNVDELLTIAKSEYDLVISLRNNLYKVVEMFTIAQHEVKELRCMPMMSTFEEMPTDLTDNYLSAIHAANSSVKSFKKIADPLLHKYFSTEGIRSKRIDSEARVNKRKGEGDSPGLGSTVEDTVKIKLNRVCNSYEKSRLLLAQELESYGQLLKPFVLDLSAINGDALFDARGELVVASREALLKAEGSFFFGLLNSGKWKTNDIGTASRSMLLYYYS